MPLGCGACNLCCKLLAVPDIFKPARMLCWWTNIHGGCSRHAEKPTEFDPSHELMACAQFKCLWLESQTHEDIAKRLPRHLRPDQSHVVMGPQDRNDDTLIYFQIDPNHPGAYLDLEIQDYINGIVSRGGRVELVIGETHVDLGVDGGTKAYASSAKAIEHTVEPSPMTPTQNADEMEWFLNRFVAGRQSVLEIGCETGSMLKAMAARLNEGAVVRGISLAYNRMESAARQDAVDTLRNRGIDADVLMGDSHDPMSIEWARRHAPYDIVFIDADHSYDAVRADWLDYGPMGKVVAFHDMSNKGFGVPTLWKELKAQGLLTEERVANPGIMGIGVVIQSCQ